MQLTKDEPRVMTTSEVLALATETLIKGCKLSNVCGTSYTQTTHETFILQGI